MAQPGGSRALVAALGVVLVVAGSSDGSRASMRRAPGPAEGLVGSRTPSGSQAVEAGDTELSPADPDHFEASAFGFEPGEERRYRLGPDTALQAGEEATWRIRFDGFRGEGTERRALFHLTHRRSEMDHGAFNLGDARVYAVEIEGTVRVNRHGFPLQVEFQEAFRISGAEQRTDGVRTILYEFDPEERAFRKRLPLGKRDYDVDVPIVSQDRLDLGVPRGMYLFMPSALACLGRRDSLHCGEFAFANPGLISLAFPALWLDEYGDREFLFFQPTGLGGNPLGLIDVARQIRLERDRLRSRERYYEHVDLRLEEKVEVEVGGRTMRTWRIDVGGPLRSVYALPDGRVVKVEIDPHPVTHRDRWIRQIFPAEYDEF